MGRYQEIKSQGKEVATLTLPVLVEQFFIIIMGIINTIIASNLGKEVISAIGMIDAISNIVIAVFAALALGGTVAVAQYTGYGDPEKANQAAAQAVISCLVIAGFVTLLILVFQGPLIRVLFARAEPEVMNYAMIYLSVSLWSYLPIALINTAFGVLRGAGDTRTPMKVSILMNIFNIVFSYFLIYGLQFNLGGIQIIMPGYGIRGAAIGLTLARLFGALLVLIPLFRGSKRIQMGSAHFFRIQPAMQKIIFSIGIPASMEQLMFNGGRLIVQTFIVHLGTVAMAANTIATSIYMIMMIPGYAMMIAATTLVGQQIGRGQPQQAKKLLKFLLGACSIAMALLSLILFPLLNKLVSLYTNDQQTIQTTTFILLSMLIAQPLLWPVAFVIPAGLRGAGDVRYSMAVSMISMWLMRISLGYVFSVLLPWGVLGIWLAMYADWIFRSVFYVHRMHGGRWLKKSILD